MYSYKQKNKNITNRRRKSIIFIVISFVLITIGCGYFYAAKMISNNSTSEGTIRYEAATKIEKQEAENNKNNIVKSQQNKNNNPSSPNTSTQKQTVKPTITNTNGSINAYVSGIFESGGTCTATFTKGSTTLTKTSAGFENVSYTQCTPINIDSSFLESGSWTVFIKYNSEKSEGMSDSQQMEVY